MVAENTAVTGMAGIRAFSAVCEFTGAMLMFHYGSVDKALKINSLLAMVGPAVLLTTTTLGLAGMVGKVPLWKIFAIVSGVGIIFFAANRG